MDTTETPVDTADRTRNVARPERDPDDVILRMPAIVRITGMGKSTVWKTLKEDPEFPRPVRLGKRSVGIWRSELFRWLRNRPRI